MRIIVIGAGEVGFHIAKRLIQEGHDIVLIDERQKLLDLVSEELDALTIQGNGANPELLAEAGLKDAGMLIAVSNQDAVNLVACHLAAANGVEVKIARVQEPAYLREDLKIKGRDFGADLLIDQAQEVAKTIARLVRTPGAIEAADFLDGGVEVVGLRVAEGAPLTKKPLQELKEEVEKPRFLLVAISREEKVYIPHGSSVVEPSDVILAAVKREAIGALGQACGLQEKEAKRVFIIGGGQVGLHVAELLLADDHEVKVMEADEARCHHLASLLPDALVLNGDGTDVRVLLTEGIDDADVVVTVSDDDETNLLSAIMAKQQGARRSIALIKRPDYAPLVFSLGIDAAISPRLVTASVILRYILRAHMLAEFTTAFREAEAVELEVAEKAKATKKPLSELGLSEKAIIGAVSRNGEILIPRGETTLQGGDRVILFALTGALRETSRLFR